MGLCVVAKGLKAEDSFDCGYITYNRFLTSLAKTFNEKSGTIYEKFLLGEVSYEELVQVESAWPDALKYFLYHSDCDGKFTWKECRDIYKVLQPLSMEMRGHNYSEVQIHTDVNGSILTNVRYYNMLEQWKGMFYHCWKHRVNMYYA